MGRVIIIAAFVLMIVWGVGSLGGLITNGVIHLILGLGILLLLVSFVGREI